MKRIYVNFFICIMLLAGQGAWAALSGVYTINSGLSTSGTNFQTFADFKTAITTQGVSGPVTVNVVSASGPYYEQVAFTPITGASSINTITINGNGNILSFNSSNASQRYTLMLNGADFMYFHNLKTEGTGTYQWTLILTGNADDNMFSNCTFSCQANTTSSSHMPIMISGSPTDMYNTTSSASRNSFVNCETFSGYCSLWMYGTNGSRPVGNSFTSCKFQDWYQYGIYSYYGKDILYKNCIIERLNRTTFTQYNYVTMFGYQEGLMFDGNLIHKLYDQNKTYNAYNYGIYGYYNSQSNGANPNVVRNNIIKDIECNGTLFGLYYYYLDGDIIHNTISFDHTASTSSGNTWGAYTYGGSGYHVNFANNIISITRGGSGSKYGIYYGTTGSGTSSSNNDYYISATNANVAYYGGNHPTVASIQAAGQELNSVSINPAYTNLAAGNLIPTATALNNLGAALGVPVDFANLPRSGTTPDIGAHEFLSANCSGTPSVGTVVTPTYQICPGENVNMILSNFSSDLGVSYQWQSSTQSAVGLWTQISGANSVLYTAKNVTTTTWYQVVVTCTNSNQTVNVVGQVTVAGTTTNTAPYYENFEGISKTNQLPNCSWSANGLGGVVMTYTGANTQNRVPRSGSKFATYYYAPNGVRTMYTNGIWLNAGVTYSASVWYTTEYYGYNNWTNLGIYVGPNQSTAGQQLVASTGGPAVSIIYKPLSNTFNVPTSGLYYVAITATVSNSSYAYYLSWDDLAIEIPCSLNSPTVNVAASQASVCAGTAVNLQASGADTYTWSTGDEGSTTSATPMLPGSVTYYVTGTNSLSGCALTASQSVYVNPAPNIYIVANPPVICEGQTSVLQAFGASNYIWTNNQTGAFAQVNPANTTTYAVNGANNFQCQGVAVIQITVNPKPTIKATGPSTICSGDQVAINGTGGISYVVVSPNSHNTTNPALVSPHTTTQFTMTGKDAKGCENTDYITLDVRECVGLNELARGGAVKVHPNPTNGMITIDGLMAGENNLTVTDVTGRVLSSSKTTDTSAGLDMSMLSNGVYYVRITNNSDVVTIRVIRN
jgi:hypothetical protein